VHSEGLNPRVGGDCATQDSHEHSLVKFIDKRTIEKQRGPSGPNQELSIRRSAPHSAKPRTCTEAKDDREGFESRG